MRVMVNEIIADMLDMSDDEILKEADEVESVSDEDLEKARSIYQKASRIAARERLRQAREALLEHKSSSGKGGKIIDIATVRLRLKWLLSQEEINLTCAARNFQELDDDELLRMYNDYLELGAFDAYDDEHD